MQIFDLRAFNSVNPLILKTLINSSLMKAFYLLLITSVSWFALSAQTPLDKVDFYTTDDLAIESIFQNPKFEAYYNKTYDSKRFFDKYFYPWKTDKTSIAKVIKQSSSFGAFFEYSEKLTACHTGNYQAYPSPFIDDLIENTAAVSYPNTLEHGIVLERTDVRQLPTEEYCWKRVHSAGEGYPFDYFQETSLWIATPVLVLHHSKDAMWYFIETAYSKGWVQAKTIGLVSEKQRKDLLRADYAVILQDDLVVETATHPIRLRVGTLLPMLRDKSATKVRLPKATRKNVSFEELSLDKAVAQKMPLAFNAENVKNLLPELLGGKYSWGGVDGGRDCSSTIKDFMTPFGIWLPRNSSQQHKVGKVALLEGTKEDKFNRIEEEGIPFLSIIYKRGHAMLYVGQDQENKPLIFQNVWGLKPIFSDERLLQVAQFREEYGLYGISGANFFTEEVLARYIIGKAVITSVNPEQHFAPSKKLKFKYFMDAIQSINCFVE